MLNESDLVAALEWQIAMGVEDCMSDHVIDRYALFAEKQSAKKAQTPSQPNVASASVSGANSALSRLEKNKKNVMPSQNSGVTERSQRDMVPLGMQEAMEEAKRIARDAGNLAALKDAIEQFDGCPLKATATHTVFDAGADCADILIIGDSPGPDEDRQGRPFVGPEGQLLDQIMGYMGLQRQDLLVNHTVFWRPPGNRTPNATEIASCLPFLQRMIALSKPKIIITLGSLSAAALLGERGRSARIRGKMQSYQTSENDSAVPLFPMISPSHLLKTPALKEKMWEDCLNLHQIMEDMGVSVDRS